MNCDCLEPKLCIDSYLLDKELRPIDAYENEPYRLKEIAKEYVVIPKAEWIKKQWGLI